jgi:putative FmdB family regulatory protein
MPLYDYKCFCGHDVEITHLMVHKPTILCFKCGKVMVKAMNAPLVTFKGDGFYSNDK